MTVMQNEQTLEESITLNFKTDPLYQEPQQNSLIPAHLAETASALLLPSRLITHNPKAGLNPLADVAGYLFSVIGKLKQLQTYRELHKLQAELMHEINAFEENIKGHGYNTEYVVVCRYVLCATIDDIISHTAWGDQGQWEPHSMLAAFNQDTQHADKFFTILDRAIKEPTHYIDLMELMYICLSLGYKGPYRVTEQSQFELEQITNTLYKHIRVYRGHFSKTLSPTPFKAFRIAAKAITQRYVSPMIILFFTACIVMIIFIGLSYLMDVISNEAYKNIAEIQRPSAVQLA